MAYGGLPFSGHCPVPGVYIYYVPDMINVCILFLHLSTPLDVPPTKIEILLWTRDWKVQNGPPLQKVQNGREGTEWASFTY